MKNVILFFLTFISIACQSKTIRLNNIYSDSINKLYNIPKDTNQKTIHIFVALCDNKYQGIVPVPAKIGNGQDPNNNLYWGCGNGIRTYFKKSKEWTLVKTYKVDSVVLERLVFKHKTANLYLICDAYDGKEIKRCTREFLLSASGKFKDTINVNGKQLGIFGNSKLVSYIGHDGLMEFEFNEEFTNIDGKTRDCIILACVSKRYFSKHIQEAKARPLVWTTQLMCPEAYTVHDAISAWIRNEKPEQIRIAAAMAYSKNQKCSVKAAKGLLVTGF